MSKEQTNDLLKFLKPFPADIQKTALWLREFVWDLYPQANELIYDSYNAVAFGWSITDKLGQMFCGIGVFRSNYNIHFSFYWGSELSDPDKILIGQGKRYRYILVKRKEDFPKSYIKKLMKEAYTNSLTRVKDTKQIIQGSTITNGFTKRNENILRKRNKVHIILITNNIIKHTMKKIILLLTIFLSLNILSVSAQTWQAVGVQSFSAPVTMYSLTSIVLDHNGTPYVAYSDASVSGKLTVMTFNGASWVPVGNVGFTAGQGYDMSVAIDTNNIPYVAFGDGGNSSHASVMKFNGTNWIYIGAPGFSDGVVNNCTLKFDSHDTAYVSYVDAFYSGKAVVKKFNGTSWVTIGTPGFTAGGTGQMTMALNNSSTPYIVYQDQTNGFAASSMMFDGINWVHVGNSTFSVAQCQFCHIAFDNTGTAPYICYNEGYGQFSPNVQMYNGSAWVYVGGQNLNTNMDYQNNIAIDGNNIPYVIFPDGAYSAKATVMNYTGSSWVTSGNAGFSTGEIWYPNIVIDAMNNIYAEYYDEGDSNKVSVMKLGNTSAVSEMNTTNTISVYPNPSNSIVTFHVQNASPASFNFQLFITDVFGKEIFKYIVKQAEISIDVSSWSQGIYFYEVSGSNEITRGRFVKE